jgi:hypothetical protein
VEPSPFMSAITCRGRMCQLPNVPYWDQAAPLRGAVTSPATGLCAGRTDAGMQAQVDRAH